MQEEVAVYLFLGFLESGKTKFIQETLQDPRFNSKGKTVILICEEGEEEYDPSGFSSPNCEIRTIESQAEFTEENLLRITEETKADRILVEYNGMWLTEVLFNAMPECWAINQIMTFADSNTYLRFNANMRQLVFDKLQYTEMIVFNRLPVGADYMPLHKIVRAVNRRCRIVYEYTDGKVELDEVVDPMPFDINAPVIEIADKDYALWYFDITEDNMDSYIGKTIRLKGMIANEKQMRLGKGQVMFGRHVMRCCEADIEYSPLVCKCGENAKKFKTYDWVLLKAKIALEYNPMYGKKGPVLQAIEMSPCDPPEPQLAQVY